MLHQNSQGSGAPFSPMLSKCVRRGSGEVSPRGSFIEWGSEPSPPILLLHLPGGRRRSPPSFPMHHPGGPGTNPPFSSDNRTYASILSEMTLRKTRGPDLNEERNYFFTHLTRDYFISSFTPIQSNSAREERRSPSPSSLRPAPATAQHFIPPRPYFITLRSFLQTKVCLEI